jgi:hypothetical protein
MTMVDLFEKGLRAKMKEEFLQRKGNQAYRAMIPDGAPTSGSGCQELGNIKRSLLCRQGWRVGMDRP